ncbi:MAG TPA: prolipoprotein diacylglyceryl transferase family protein [Gemmataceae bacterium]|nr:prolipoprotein diacylglyceryl transferase family protein [Gemmataceae bacterium]
MQQVLFKIPGIDWPVYGYGMMLFLAYFFCTWLACWLAKKEGISAVSIQDLSIWVFICGIAGARLTFMLQYHIPLMDFWKIWDGGLVFYGSAIGGVVGYFGAYFFVLRKHNVSTWKMADVIAPCAALGLCLGRVGCLLNGCCYGNVACPDCPSIGFPLPTHARFELVRMGYQTAAGFTFKDQSEDTVDEVEPDSDAARAGLQPGDKIKEIQFGDEDMKKPNPFSALERPPQGQNTVTFKVLHANGVEALVGPFTPWTIGLHPTQIYESVSMALLFLLLLAYFPYRRRDGAVMVLFMICYACHRFLNEMLRNDTDAVGFGMTLSQNISIIVLVSGLLLGAWLWLKTPRQVVE